MILKIKRVQEGYDWVYFDDVKRVSVFIPKDFFIIQRQDEKHKEEQRKYLSICGLTDGYISNGICQIDENRTFDVDEEMWDSEDVLKQAMINEKGEKQRWDVKILYVYFNKDCPYVVACYSWNNNIFLLNDEGKTIERL